MARESGGMEEYTITYSGETPAAAGNRTLSYGTLHTPEERLRAVEVELDALGALAELLARRVERLEERLARLEATEADAQP